MDNQNQYSDNQPVDSPNPTVNQTQAVNSVFTSPANPQQPNLLTNIGNEQQSPVSPSPGVVVSDHMPVNQGSKPNTKKGHKLVLLIVIAILVLGGLGSVYALYIHKPKTVTSTKVYTGSASNGTTKASVTAPVTSTVNCGSDSCFNQKFTACSPATDTSTALGTTVKYQIYGPKGGGCSMLFEYTQVANPAWQNQPMTCNYDNKESLENSSQAVMNDLLSGKNTYSCSGPLVAILQSQSSGSQ